jgi:raffinose/stachyose/melibiose transport system permease protein
MQRRDDGAESSAPLPGAPDVGVLARPSLSEREIAHAMPPEQPGRSLRSRIYRGRLAYLFLLPTFLLLGVFDYYPVWSALYHSFFRWNGFTPGTFIGFDNFVTLFHDPLMHAATANVLKLTAFTVFITISVPLVVARVIHGVPGRLLQFWFRVLFVIPLIMTDVVILLIWKFVYDPNFGILNAGLQALHIWRPQAWLGDPREALYSIMGIGFPWVDGFALLIFSAGLQNIPKDLYEAADIDGAGTWRRFWRIELPLVMGQVKLIAILSMIWSIQDFTAILILTQGGPGTATLVPGMLLYQAGFENEFMGYASAIGTTMFLVLLLLTYLNLKYVKSQEYTPRGA